MVFAFSYEILLSLNAQTVPFITSKYIGSRLDVWWNCFSPSPTWSIVWHWKLFGEEVSMTAYQMRYAGMVMFTEPDHFRFHFHRYTTVKSQKRGRPSRLLTNRSCRSAYYYPGMLIYFILLLSHPGTYIYRYSLCTCTSLFGIVNFMVAFLWLAYLITAAMVACLCWKQTVSPGTRHDWRVWKPTALHRNWKPSDKHRLGKLLRFYLKLMQIFRFYR